MAQFCYNYPLSYIDEVVDMYTIKMHNIFLNTRVAIETL
jgi:hypothetical protein